MTATAAASPAPSPARASGNGPPPVPPPSGKAGTRSFLGKFWRFLVGIKDALALLFLLLFFVALFGALAARPTTKLAVNEGALVLTLDGFISEQPADVDPFASLSGFGGDQVTEHRLRDVVRALELAATDDRIKAVVLDLDQFLGGGQVALTRVGKAIDTVRKADKPVLTYATGYTDRGYQLAAHASEVWTDPYGAVFITGRGGSNLYYKGLIDRLGVSTNVFRVGTFKSAIEPFIRADASPEAKAANIAYARVLWDQWQADVKKARPKARLDDYIADPVGAMRAANNDAARAALNARLVDKLGSRLAFDTHLATLVGQSDDNQPWSFNAIPMDNWLANNPEKPSGDAIAVVPVVGEIVDGEAPSGVAGGDTVAGHILDAITDDSVKALVLRVDSPGGSVLASEKIRQALMRAKAKKLPIVVSMANVAASGGYWVSTPADRIFAQPDTITGSIGVFGLLPTFENTLAKVGITSDGITTTPLSGQPDIVGGLNDTMRDLGQASVDDIYARFTGLVAKSRKLPLDKLLPNAEGRVWAGSTARELGLVDEFGGLEEAVAHAAKLAKVEGDFHARVFENQPDPFTRFLAGLMGGGEVPAARSGAPRGWMAQQAAERQQVHLRVIGDMRRLIASPSVQASCLECKGFAPAPARPLNRAEQSWWAAVQAAAGR